ncbi:hypothetical protein NLX83_11825 [Allokutzneria sp. A3M-2-11 16]|uniref:hypothetical protein n=1 Tax=Allokutzneria sp. A3M-2-11 16 TaxID=2962043 RepID=UPI0020B84BC4|nr:hypothetical protein [Allokutzneria sp. A3M-2-11 16]MCP3799944.1 hypothetical protein [Allokutzneria sp. A3M-2-11 16]
MRKQATVLGLAAAITGATLLAPATANAASFTCADHDSGEVCVRVVSSSKLEVRYKKTNGSGKVSFGYRNGSSYVGLGDHNVKKNESKTVPGTYRKQNNACIQGVVYTPGSEIARGLKSPSVC